MTTLEENIAQLKTALAQVEEELKATSESTNVQQSAVMNYDSYASDIADLKAKIDYLTKQQSDYKSIQSDLENIKEEVLRTSEQINELKSSQPSVVANNVTQVLPEEQITSILADIEFLKKELIDLRNIAQTNSTGIVAEIDRISNVERKYDDLANKIAIISSTDIEIQNELNSIKQEIENIKRASDEVSNDALSTTDLDTLFESLKSRVLSSAEIKALVASVDQISKLEANVESVKQKISLIENNVQNLTLKTDEKVSKEELGKIITEVENLKEVLSELSAISINSESIENISKAIESKNQNLDKLSNDILSVTNKVNDLAIKISEISDRISQLSQSTSQGLQQVDMESLKNRVKNLEADVQNKVSVAQLNSVNQNIQKVLSMVLDLEERVKSIQQSSQMSQSQASTTMLDVSQYVSKDQLNDLSTEVSTLKEDLSKLSSRMDELSSLTKVSSVTSMTQVDEFLQKSTEIEEKLADLNKRYDQLSQDVSSKVGMTELQEKFTSIWNEMNGIKKTLSDVDINFENLNEKIQSLEKNVNTLSEKLDDIAVNTVSAEQFQHSSNALNLSIEELQNQQDKFEMRLQEMEDRLTNLELESTKFLDFSKDFENNLSNMVTLSQFNDALGALDDKFSGQLSEQAKEYEKKLSEMDERLTAKNVLIEGKIDELTNTLDAKVNQLSERDTQLEESIMQLTEKQSGVQEITEELQKSYTLTSDRVSTLELELANEKGRTDALINTTSELSQKQDNLQKSIEDIQKSSVVTLEEASKTSDRISKLELELQNEKQKTLILTILLIGFSLGTWIMLSIN